LSLQFKSLNDLTSNYDIKENKHLTHFKQEVNLSVEDMQFYHKLSTIFIIINSQEKFLP